MYIQEKASKKMSMEGQLTLGSHQATLITIQTGGHIAGAGPRDLEKSVKPEGQRRNAKNPSSQTNCSCAKLKGNLVIFLFEKYSSYFYEQ